MKFLLLLLVSTLAYGDGIVKNLRVQGGDAYGFNIRKNGTVISYGVNRAWSATSFNFAGFSVPVISGIIYMNGTTDFLSLYTRLDAGATISARYEAAQSDGGFSCDIAIEGRPGWAI